MMSIHLIEEESCDGIPFIYTRIIEIGEEYAIPLVKIISNGNNGVGNEIIFSIMDDLSDYTLINVQWRQNNP